MLALMLAMLPNTCLKDKVQDLHEINILLVAYKLIFHEQAKNLTHVTWDFPLTVFANVFLT